ncbi:unnamed protein product, partial [Timema podura]|nr:unnamed protein product [Timema podura]
MLFHQGQLLPGLIGKSKPLPTWLEMSLLNRIITSSLILLIISVATGIPKPEEKKERVLDNVMIQSIKSDSSRAHDLTYESVK